MTSGKAFDSVVTQVAVVVWDIDKARKNWAKLLGVPAPDVRETAEQSQTGAEYMGQPTAGRAKLAFFNLGSVTLELIEPIGGPSTWREFLETKGEGIHHIAFKVRGTDEIVKTLAPDGISLQQQGRFPGGRYTYLDAREPLGVIIELLETVEAK